MKRLFAVIALFMAINISAGDSYVYICTGPKAKRYHKTEKCRGLQNCSGEITKVTIEKAKAGGKTPCKICY